MPGFNKKIHWIRNIIILLAFAFGILALSNPQWANKREKIKVQSSDIFIALDISQSMLAKDISPNRLERSKKFVENLIEKLKGNRIGLIFFAGDAFMKMPLTSDYAAAKMFIKTANPDLIENQGTAIEEAISIAEKGFDEKMKHQRAMVIFSDGEDHDGNAVEKAKTAHDNGLIIFTVGVGTSKGAFIPFKNRYGVEVYKKDNNGAVVKTTVNEELMNEIADNGGGRFYSILQGDEVLNSIHEQLERIEKREIEQRSFTQYESYFQYFLAIAILLFIIQFFIKESRVKI
jgi:Ca-activated chloride channel family protein